jgi:hypothetical protein
MLYSVKRSSLANVALRSASGNSVRSGLRLINFGPRCSRKLQTCVPRHEAALEAAGETIGEYSNKVVDYTEKAFKQFQTELWATIGRQYGELQGRLDAVLPDARSRSKDFKFVGERDADSEPVDLPNPLSRRRGMN